MFPINSAKILNKGLVKESIKIQAKPAFLSTNNFYAKLHKTVMYLGFHSKSMVVGSGVNQNQFHKN